MDTIPVVADKENLTIRVDRTMRDQLDRIALAEDRSVSSVVRLLLAEALRAREGR